MKARSYSLWKIPSFNLLITGKDSLWADLAVLGKKKKKRFSSLQ
jgi:hypothetical protein